MPITATFVDGQSRLKTVIDGPLSLDDVRVHVQWLVDSGGMRCADLVDVRACRWGCSAIRPRPSAGWARRRPARPERAFRAGGTMDRESLVAVGAFLNHMEADLARSALEAAGIESMVRGDDCGGMYPTPWMGQSQVALLVREDDADAARDVLSQEARE